MVTDTALILDELRALRRMLERLPPPADATARRFCAAVVANCGAEPARSCGRLVAPPEPPWSGNSRWWWRGHLEDVGREVRWSARTCTRSALQRVLPVAAGERTHGERHQADVRFGHWRWTERQLYEVQLTPDIDWGVSLHR